MAPTTGWGDSPELTTAAYQLGVSHPTGYPLYMLLGHAAIFMIPVGDPGFRMNLLSALLSAGAVAVAHRLGERLTGSLLGGWGAALALALAPLFWAHALIAEVYALASLLTLLLLLEVVLWDQTGKAAHLRWAALLLGLNLAHHLGIVLLGPGLAVYVLTSRHRAQLWRQLPLLLLLGGLPLLAYLYIPLRARSDPWLNWADARTPRAAWAHVTGQFYRSMMFATPRANVLLRVRELPGLWLYQLGWTGLVLLAVGLGTTTVGATREARRRRGGDLPPRVLGDARLLFLLLPWGLISVVWGVGYWVFDYPVFYIPAVLAASLFCGVGVGWLARWGSDPALPGVDTLDGALGARAPLPARGPKGNGGITPPVGARGPSGRARVPALPGTALAIVLLVLLGVRGVRPEVSRRGDWSALRYARAVAQALPRRAVVLGLGDNQWFPLIYVLGVERARPDVLLFNLWDTRLPASQRLFTRWSAPDFVLPRGPRAVAPGETDPDYRWLIALIQENVRRRPVVLLTERNKLVGRDIWAALGRYYQVARTNLPFWELYPLPPETPLATEDEERRGRDFTDSTQLLSLKAVPEQENGVSWVRIDSEWLVRDLGEGEKLVARVRFVPPGSARATVDQRIPLGYGYFPVTVPDAPRTWRGSFWTFVPPAAAGREQRVMVGLERNGQPVETLNGGREMDAGMVTPPPLGPCR